MHKIILGPMEGVLDYGLRSILTSINRYDLCITEFVRVVDQLLPKKVFYRTAPELLNHDNFKNKTPIRIQLLGNDENWLSENAARAIELGSKGVDLNFGCPAKTVNKNKGGAILLKEPETVYKITNKVKKDHPDHHISAKIRLGWDSHDKFKDLIFALDNAKVDSITIHARTKKDGYKPENIDWSKIAQAKSWTDIPLIANGEVWNKKDAVNCFETSQTHTLMLCRGAFQLPNLANTIKFNEPIIAWSQVINLLIDYASFPIEKDKGLYFSNRAKQWLTYLRHQYNEAQELFEKVKRLKNKQEVLDVITRSNAQVN